MAPETCSKNTPTIPTPEIRSTNIPFSPTTASADTLSAHNAVHTPAPPARENTVTQHTSPASLFLSLQYVLTKNQASARQGKEKQRHTSLRRVCASVREECHRLKLTQTFCVSKPRLFWNNRSSSLKQHRVLSNSQRLWAKISQRGIKPYSLQYICVCVFKALYIPFIVTNVNSLCGKTQTHTQVTECEGSICFL